jgi:hypothetical protein
MYNKILIRRFIFVLITFVYKNQTITCFISKDVFTIRDSWLIKKVADMKAIIEIIKKRAERYGIAYTRTEASWIREWKTHNLLYNMNFKRSHTVDTDLSENESRFRRFCYFFLSLFYRA